MKVILLEDVQKLGKAGEIKDVKNGYGFNFLLPNALAEFATPVAIRQAEQMIVRRRADQQTLAADFKVQSEALAGKKIIIKTRSEEGKLFGSVGREEIAHALSAMGIEIDAKIILLDKPLKKVGVFPVKAHFSPGAEASFEVVIKAE